MAYIQQNFSNGYIGINDPPKRVLAVNCLLLFHLAKGANKNSWRVDDEIKKRCKYIYSPELAECAGISNMKHLIDPPCVFLQGYCSHRGGRS